MGPTLPSGCVGRTSATWVRCLVGTWAVGVVAACSGGEAPSATSSAPAAASGRSPEPEGVGWKGRCSGANVGAGPSLGGLVGFGRLRGVGSVGTVTDEEAPP